MKQDVLKQAASYNKEHRRKIRRHRVVSALAAIVVFCTTYVLIMPAITMESEPKPVCGLEEHTHSEACYGELELVCGLEEVEAAPDGEAAPAEGHVHTDECYETVQEEQQVLDCTLAETEGHAHSDECYETRTVTTGHELICADESEEHEHTEECFSPAEDHEEQVLVCGLEECEPHAHTDACYRTETVETRQLICEQEQVLPQEPHTHSEACYAPKLICELEEHTHDESCMPEEEFTETSAPEGELPLMALLPEGAEVPEDYTQTFQSVSDSVAVEVYAPEGALPEGANLVATLLPEGSAAYHEAAAALESSQTAYDGMAALDIHFVLDGAEVEPSAPVFVCINAQGLLPEGADPASVAIQHHVDLEGVDMSAYAVNAIGLDAAPMDVDAAPVDGDLPAAEELPDVFVEPVAGTEADGGVLEITEDAGVSAAFEVNSFSYFTVTYKNSSQSQVLKVYLVDEAGKDIGPQDVQLNLNKDFAFNEDGDWSGKTRFIEDILKAADINLGTYYYSDQAYSYVGVYSERTDGTQVKWIANWDDSKGFQYSWTDNGAAGSDNWAQVENNSVYVRYKTAEPQLAFYYVLDPSTEEGKGGAFAVDAGSMEGNWYYFGSSQIYRYPNGGSGKNYPFDANQVKTDSLVYPESIEMLGENEEKVTYYWEGLPEEQIKELMDQGVTQFYDVQWVRFVDSNSSRHKGNSASTTRGDNAYLNPEDPYNNTDKLYTGSDNGLTFETDNENNPMAMKVWHVDGYLVLRPKVEVKYYVLDENGAGAQLSGLQSSGFLAGEVFNGGSQASGKTFGPIEDTGLYGTVEITQYDWYVDKACTQQWNFSTPVNESMTLYHKLEIKRPTSYNLTVGKVSLDNGKTLADEEIEDDLTPLAGLPGATFEIYELPQEDNETEKKIVELSPDKLASAAGPATANTNDKNVLLEFGKVYKLVETQAPAGYSALTDPIYFKAVRTETGSGKDIKFGVDLTLCDESGSTANVSYPEAMVHQKTLAIIVANYGGFVLPSTGGPGTSLYALGGMLLMAAAAILMYKIMRRREGGWTA